MHFIKRVLKWFAWIAGAFMLLLVLFFLVPGIKCSWRFPGEGTPWLLLQRVNESGFDNRDLALGEFRVKLVFVDTPISASPGHRGAHWESGIFWYVGERWLFSVGTKVLF